MSELDEEPLFDSMSELEEELVFDLAPELDKEPDFELMPELDEEIESDLAPELDQEPVPKSEEPITEPTLVETEPEATVSEIDQESMPELDDEEEADPKAEFTEALDAVGKVLQQAAYENKATYEVLLLIQKVYEDFYAQKMELEAKIAADLMEIQNWETMIESRNNQTEENNKAIEALQYEYDALNCNEVL